MNSFAKTRAPCGMSRRRSAPLLLSLLLTLPLPPAFGHAGLVSSEPGRRAQLSAPPSRIRLCFNETIELKFSKITLEGADGTPVALGALEADAAKPTCVVASLSALTPGNYTVKFRVLSVDGHVVEKSYGFSLKTP